MTISLPETLATEVGMKLDPFGFVDLILGLYYSRVCSLRQNSRRFLSSTKLCYIHNMIISCNVQGKILYNQNILKIVFISSKGNVTPLLGDSSHTNRSVKLIEIEDISDAEAINQV